MKGRLEIHDSEDASQRWEEGESHKPMPLAPCLAKGKPSLMISGFVHNKIPSVGDPAIDTSTIYVLELVVSSFVSCLYGIYASAGNWTQPELELLDMVRAPGSMSTITLVLHVSLREDFLGIIGQNSGVCKSNRLHVDIFRFCFINLRYIS